MANLFIMVGIPGSGKSTWCKKNIGLLGKYISRDEIRFSMVTEDEEYFSKENEVFKTFCNKITETLEKGYDVYADATHINGSSRAKTIRNVRGYDNLYVIVLDTPLTIALQQNEKRKGTRAYVPRGVIRRMSSQFVYPEYNEGFKEIYLISWKGDKNDLLSINESSET